MRSARVIPTVYSTNATLASKPWAVLADILEFRYFLVINPVVQTRASQSLTSLQECCEPVSDAQ